MRYSKSRNASTGCLYLTLGARNVIWIFLFHFSFVSSASWLVLGGVMSARCQAAIALSRIVFLCAGWLRCAVLISRIRIIHLHEFFFINWAGSHVKDDCHMGRTHCSLQDNLELTVHSMFTVPNMFGAWQRGYYLPIQCCMNLLFHTCILNSSNHQVHEACMSANWKSLVFVTHGVLKQQPSLLNFLGDFSGFPVHGADSIQPPAWAPECWMQHRFSVGNGEDVAQDTP